ncbi:MAG: hypothetical protein OXG78_13495 [Chloroflexi bacterium]|nr:hypothetical protein [Chloroflexota bacterium]
MAKAVGLSCGGLEMILEVFVGEGNIFSPMDSNNRSDFADEKVFLAIWPFESAVAS